MSRGVQELRERMRGLVKTGITIRSIRSMGETRGFLFKVKVFAFNGDIFD